MWQLNYCYNLRTILKYMLLNSDQYKPSELSAPAIATIIPYTFSVALTQRFFAVQDYQWINSRPKLTASLDFVMICVIVPGIL
jgi:hypothetical protein